MGKSKETLDGFSIWTEPKGYKVLWLDGRTIKAHVYVWEKINGPKPIGFDIHHKDFNKANYAIENLELLSKSDHHKIHAGWVLENGNWAAKPCRSCGEVKGLSEFYPRKGKTPSALCKPCHCLKTKDWAVRNPERRKKIALKYYYRKKGGGDNG